MHSTAPLHLCHLMPSVFSPASCMHSSTAFVTPPPFPSACRTRNPPGTRWAWLQLHALGLHHGVYFLQVQHVVRIPFTFKSRASLFLAIHGPMNTVTVSGLWPLTVWKLRTWGDGGGHIPKQWGSSFLIMFTNAGQQEVVSFFPPCMLRSTRRPRRRRSCRLQAHLNHVRKTGLLERGSPAGHGDIRAELASGGGRHHGDHLLAGLDQVDHVDHKGFGIDGSKGAAVHTVAALDALLLVDLADAVLVVRDRVHRAALLAGAL